MVRLFRAELKCVLSPIIFRFFKGDNNDGCVCGRFVFASKRENNKRLQNVYNKTPKGL